MPDAPDIRVKLTAEDQGVSAAIKELTSQLKNLKRAQDETRESSLSLSGAFESLVAIGGAIKLEEIGRDAFSSAVQIGKMADKTGITTQTLSVFHKVAEDVGVATEAVDKGLARAAKSITEFEQGSSKASKAFQILGITQKDFAGLNSDQKIKLVADRLGSLSAGFAKTTAAQLIFSKAGAELIPVFNSLAAQGFDKVTEATARLGLLLDQTTTDDFRAAQASIQELQDAGKGMATQFEAGLLPAISDVGEALVDSATQGGVSFKTFGSYAGEVVRGIAAVFLALGQTIGTVIEADIEEVTFFFNLVKNEGGNVFQALGEAAKGNFHDAFGTLKTGFKESTAQVVDEVGRQKAIFGSLFDSLKKDYANLFPSDDEEAKRQKERVSRLRVPRDQEVAPQQVTVAPPVDAAAKAALALLEKQTEDELALHRAYAKQTEQIDQELYAQGLLTTQQYYDRRRAEVLADVNEETDILVKGKAAAQAEADKLAHQKTLVDVGTPQGAKEADKLEADRIAALTKVEELQTKISEIQINSGTQIQALNTAQFKATEENQAKVLAFQQELDALQGKRQESAKAQIDAEAQKRAIDLAQAGQTQAQIDAEIGKWRQLKLAVADYDATRVKTEEDTKAFEIQKQGIEIKQKQGDISPLEAEREINQLIKDRLPLLQADAAAELQAAQKTGNNENVANAQNTIQATQNLSVATNTLGKQVSGALTQDFSTFFETVGRGTKSVAQSFEGLAASVIQSLEKIFEKELLTKIFGAATAGAGGGGGGFLSGIFGGLSGHAEGGLIKGPGGPKSDSIPARVSPGEFIVKADAVAQFGAANLDAINRGLKIPSLSQLSLPKFAEGGLVGNLSSGGSSDSAINLGIALDEGLVLKHLSSKKAGNIILQQITNNPKAASKALSRSQ